MAGGLFADVTGWIGGRLLAGSIEGALLIGAAWLVCRRVGSIPPWIRAMVWWVVALKLVLVFVPVPAIRLPLLAHPASVTEAPGGVAAAVMPPAAPVAVQATMESHSGSGRERMRAPQALPWLEVLVGIWLVGVVAQAARLVRAHGRLRGVVSRAVAVTDEAWVPVARMARDIGLARTPDVRISAEVETPQVSGLRRPVILLPVPVGELTSEERAMTVCHELMHVRRRDLMLGWIPALAERLFFFHPLARLAAREYLVAREAACDAAVIEALGAEPKAYGRLLLRLGVARSEAGFSAAGSSQSASCLTRRLAMLDHTPFQGARRYLPWLVVAVLATTIVPVRLVARSVPVAATMSGTPSASAIAMVPDEQEIAGAEFRQGRGFNDGGLLTGPVERDDQGDATGGQGADDIRATRADADQSRHMTIDQVRRYLADARMARSLQQQAQQASAAAEAADRAAREKELEARAAQERGQREKQLAEQQAELARQAAELQRERDRQVLQAERERRLQMEREAMDQTRQMLERVSAEERYLAQELGPNHPRLLEVRRTLAGLKGALARSSGLERSPDAAALDAEIEALARSEADMAQSLGQAHPTLIALRRQLEELRAARQQADPRSPRPVTRANPPVQADRAAGQLKVLMSMQASLAQKREQLAEQQQRLAEEEQKMVRQIQALLEQLEVQKKK